MKANLPIDKLLGMAVDQGRRRFWAFCQLTMPKLYNSKHLYLHELCNTLQDFVQDKLLDSDGKTYQKLMLNLPPRHGKSLTVILLCQWLLGVDTSASIITTSYSEGLSVRMAKAVRDGIQAIKIKPNSLVYSDFFPGTKIKKGDAAMHLWSLENSHFSYLATSPGGTLTGLGGKIIITDDIIKNWYEANNERILDEHMDWYDNTLTSRKEADAKQIVIMTRWSTKDLAGKLLEREGHEWFVVKKPAQNADGSMLAPDILSADEFTRRKETNDPQLISANYQQDPYESQDRLYQEFKTYLPDLLPKDGIIEGVFDTADEGDDYLAGFIYKVHKNTAYIIDAIYTQEGMEKTEQQTAIMISKNKPSKVWIESNNGGKGFARNVERILRQDLGHTGTIVQWFSQNQNKLARILSNATNASNGIVFPDGWRQRWPILSRDLSIGKSEKWKHDDAPDAITLIVEKSLIANSASVPSIDVRGKLGL